MISISTVVAEILQKIEVPESASTLIVWITKVKVSSMQDLIVLMVDSRNKKYVQFEYVV